MTAVALFFVAVFITFGMAFLNRLQTLLDTLQSIRLVLTDLRDELVRRNAREKPIDTGEDLR